MRILQVHNRHRQPGGEDAALAYERALLHERGHEVCSLTVANPEAAWATVRTTLKAPWNRTAARAVTEQAMRFRPDVVHVHNTWYALSPSIFPALSALRFPVVTTLHNFRTTCINALLMRDGEPCELCVGNGPGPGVRHRCYRGSAVLSSIAAATVVTARRRHVWEVVSRFVVLDEGAVPPLVAGGIPIDRITVRPNFVPDPGARERPPSAGDEVVFAGRLSPEKGAEVLLDAWQADGPTGLRLTFYGDGPLRQALEGRHVRGVRFAGMVDAAELTAALLRARALVFPSTCREAGPLAPIEAAAAGLPLVISRDVGMAANVERRGAGWSVLRGDRKALAGALGRLVDDEAVDRAGAAARWLYLDRHGTEAAIRSLETIYASASLPLRDLRVNRRQTDVPPH